MRAAQEQDTIVVLTIPQGWDGKAAFTRATGRACPWTDSQDCISSFLSVEIGLDLEMMETISTIVHIEFDTIAFKFDSSGTSMF